MSRRAVKSWYRVVERDGRVDPAVPDPAPVPPPDDALARAQYEAEAARAESARIKKELDEIRKQLPSDEQRAKWAELQAQHDQAEDVRRRKEGEFDAWRQQINQKHEETVAALRNEAQNAQAQAAAHERELNDTLIGLAFSGATDWFGPNGKTVLLPAIAQAYFARNVEIEVIPGVNGGKSARRVVVKDDSGAVIVDTKTGKPLAFEKAIGDLIESHPQKNSILRGTGRVGSGSPGGTGGGNEIDVTRLRSGDFQKPEVREAVRQSQQQPGGLQIGPGFDRLRKNVK